MAALDTLWTLRQNTYVFCCDSPGNSWSQPFEQCLKLRPWCFPCQTQWYTAATSYPQHSIANCA